MIFNLLDSMWPQSQEPTPTELVLYNAGDENADVTGGWSAFAPAWAGSTAVMYEGESAATLRQNPVGCTKNADSLSIYFKLPNSQASFANGAFGSENSLNLSGYSTLHVRASRASSSGISGLNYCVCGVTASKTPPTDGTNTPPGAYTAMSAGETTMDISSLSNGYVYIGGMSRANGPTTMDKIVNIVVTKIWLT